MLYLHHLLLQVSTLKVKEWEMHKHVIPTSSSAVSIYSESKKIKNVKHVILTSSFALHPRSSL
jgi:hypothetical protein